MLNTASLSSATPEELAILFVSPGCGWEQIADFDGGNRRREVMLL
jgi:hypothetical protein